MGKNSFFSVVGVFIMYKTDLDFYALTENKELALIGHMCVTDTDFSRAYTNESSLRSWMATTHKHLFVGVDFGICNEWYVPEQSVFTKIYEYVDGRFERYLDKYPYPFEPEDVDIP